MVREYFTGLIIFHELYNWDANKNVRKYMHFNHLGPLEGSKIVNAEENPGEKSFIDSFPLVQIVGNHRIVIEHYSRTQSSSGRYEVRYA